MNGHIIDIYNLSKYYGKSRGVERVDLQVEPGEIFGFIGPNGSGKSTTIRILLNLIFPTSGTAKIMGLDVTTRHKQIMRHIGYVPSEANAYRNLSVMEFLKYCYRFYQKKPDEKRISELSLRFELDLQRKISDLSMGNRKKVSIIQSLLHKPDLLILDEPTTGLDPLMQARFFNLLREENANGMTVFFSSHILNEVQLLCNRVAIIKDGNIVRVEEISTLRKKQLKMITVQPDHLADQIRLLSGFEREIQTAGNRFSFMFSGNVNTFVKFLYEREVSDLIIEEPSLEEIFMHYYR
jgi:ABC-2 type transport system ATP-binding protein